MHQVSVTIILKHNKLLYVSSQSKMYMISQNEAEELIKLKKWLTDSQVVTLKPGQNAAYDLDSSDPAEKFILDIWRGTISLKARFQTRARKTVVLVRLDLNGAPHTNPDGEIIKCPHIHVFREGYDDKWAYPVDVKKFSDTSEYSIAFSDFCSYCNISTPNFERTLL